MQYSHVRHCLHPPGGAQAAALASVQFAAGRRVGGLELSPRMSQDEQRALAFWLLRLPGSFTDRLPPLKLAVADELRLARGRVLINDLPELPPGSSRPSHDPLHAASFIPQRYVVLHRRLFRRRVELGRILYHELCHFVWPRLGNPLRKSYEAVVRAEIGKGTRGELGYSSEWRKEKLLQESRSGERPLSRPARLWREYVCESFCDTASYVLLGSERRSGHSEYTLNRTAKERRRRWMAQEGIGNRKPRRPESKGRG